eukprot:5568447-Alexandrium_andersonii.AAC.1
MRLSAQHAADTTRSLAWPRRFCSCSVWCRAETRRVRAGPTTRAGAGHPNRRFAGTPARGIQDGAGG